MSEALHFFSPEVAEKVGIPAAIVYQNIRYWVGHNAAHGKHFYDGRYWTYASVTGMAKLFPYLSEKQVRSALEKLLEDQMIETGNHNKTPYDRTKWYCLSGQIHLPKRANGNDPQGEPIPDVTTDREPDELFSADALPASSQKKKSENTEEQFESFWTVYPRKIGKGAARASFARALKKADADQIIVGARRYAAHVRQAKTEEQFIAHGSTWLNQERWTDALPDVPVSSSLSEVEMLLAQAKIEDSLGNPAEAARYRSEARKKGWQG